MAQNNLERQLRAGIRAAQQGDQQRARELLEDVLRRDRDNELAWIWLASVVQSTRERRICLERVLKINPRNARAREALNSLVGVIGQGVNIDFNAIAAQAVTKLAEPEQRPAGRTAAPLPGRPGGGLSRNQIFTLLGGAAVLLGILMILSFVLPPLLTPSATPTPRPVAVAETTEESTEEVREVRTTPTFSGTLVTRAVTQPATFTPTITPTPTNTPTATATLPPIEEYNLIYVAQQGDSSPSLYTVSANGSGGVPLVTMAGDFDYSFASGRIAFVRGVLYESAATTEGGDPVRTLMDEIFLATIDAPADAVQITRDEDSRSYAPSISPDGRQLIFVSDRDGDPELYLYDVTTRVSRQLTDNANIDTDPHWSPDGTRVVFISDRRTPGKTELFILDLQQSDPNTAVTQLTDSRGSKLAPRWSPDSSQIAFSGESGDDFNIYIIDADGQRIRQLTRIGGVQDSAPAWTPDGNYLLFVSNRSGTVSQIYISTLDGETIRRIPTDGQNVVSVQVR